SLAVAALRPSAPTLPRHLPRASSFVPQPLLCLRAWNEIEEGHLRAYRNQMLYHPSSITGRPYSTRTINGRLRRLAMFYSWAFRRGLIDRVPFEYDTVRAPIKADAQLIAHLRWGGALPALYLTVREYRNIPTPLSVL